MLVGLLILSNTNLSKPVSQLNEVSSTILQIFISGELNV